MPPLVLDGEIAVPDERGVTHIDALTKAMRQRRAERFAYFAFDLLHLDGHDLRRCSIEDRKMLLQDVIAVAGCPRLVTVDAARRCSRRCASLSRSAPAACIGAGKTAIG